MILRKPKAITQTLLIFIFFMSSCGQSNNSSITPTLFLVDSIGELKYRFMLYGPKAEKLYNQTIDLSTTKWNVAIHSTRFNTEHGTEKIHYNPQTKEIIFLLYPLDERGNVNALPKPPFQFAIYKTSFETQKEFTLLYSENSSDFFVEHTVLSPQTNSLYIDGGSFSELSRAVQHPEILKFDIATKTIEHIAYTEDKMSGKDLAERSDLRLSSDGQKLYQLVLYNYVQDWIVIEETLYLKTINLEDQSTSYQEIVKGSDIQFNILALSAGGDSVAYYTTEYEQDQKYLWVKDLTNESVKSIPLPSDIGNFSLFMTSDGQKILVGFMEGDLESVRYYWQIYDINNDEYQTFPLDTPLAWDSSGRYFAGINDGSYIIYDIETSNEIKIKTPLSNYYSIESAQWR